MNKRKFQILSLIISIIVMVYLCLSYHGIIRALRLKLYSSEYYINKYPKLPKADKKKVVLVFSINRDEVKDIKPFINSLLDQTVRVDDIALSVNTEDKDILPEELKKVVNTYTYDKNYDDLGTVIPTVLREPETNTKIIVLEPMKIYGEDFVQSIVEKSNENGDKIIHVKNYPNIILIKPSFFSENFCNYETGHNCNQWIEKCCGNEKVVVDYEDILSV